MTVRGSSGSNSGPSSECVIKASPQMGAEQFSGRVEVGLDGSFLAPGQHGNLPDRHVSVVVQQDRDAQSFRQGLHEQAYRGVRLLDLRAYGGFDRRAAHGSAFALGLAPMVPDE